MNVRQQLVRILKEVPVLEKKNVLEMNSKGCTKYSIM